MLERRVTRTQAIDALRASHAREAAFAAWDASPLRDDVMRGRALRDTVAYLRAVLPAEGYTLGRELGAGVWGSVYALEGSDLVVKLTLDPYEAGFARFVQNSRPRAPQYPKIYGVYKTRFGTYLIFREGLLPAESVPAPPERLEAARERLLGRLRADAEVLHMDLHAGNILYRVSGDRIDAVVADLGLTSYPTPSVVAEVNPKRNPMALYPEPSPGNTAIIIAGFDRSLSNAAARALRDELPELAAQLAEDWPESPDLVEMAPGRKKRAARVVVPLLVEPFRGQVTRGKVRTLLAEAAEALAEYAAAAAKLNRTLEVYVHTLGADMGADADDVAEDIQDALSAYSPKILSVSRVVEPLDARKDRLLAQVEAALADGDRLGALRLLRALKSAVYAESRRSR